MANVSVLLGHSSIKVTERHYSPWTDYDLIVSASMLEYVPRKRLAEALAALRGRLTDQGRLILFITKRNWLTRPPESRRVRKGLRQTCV